MKQLQEININLQVAGALASNFEKKGKKDMASHILQIASIKALQDLQAVEIRYKVECQLCHKQLRIGHEIEFYKHTNQCFDCEQAYSDYLADCYIDPPEREYDN